MPDTSHHVTESRATGAGRLLVWLAQFAKLRFTALLSPPGDTDWLRLVGVSFYLGVIPAVLHVGFTFPPGPGGYRLSVKSPCPHPPLGAFPEGAVT